MKNYQRLFLAGITLTGFLLRTQAAPTASVASASVSPAIITGSATPTASATVGATFDGDSNSGWVEGRADRISSTTIGLLTVNLSRVDTQTVTTVSGKTLSATDGTAPLSFGSATSGSYSSSLTPSAGDGIKSVTITATAAETVTTVTSTSTIYGNRVGATTTWYEATRTAPVSSPPVITNPSATASATARYLVDLQAPEVKFDKNTPPSISQGQDEKVHVQIDKGSAGQDYSFKAVATAPDGSTHYTGTTIGTFKTSADGIAGVQNEVWSVSIPCDAPLGTYTLKIYVNSTDLNGGSWPEVELTGTDFTVTPGLTIAAQTVILSDFGAAGYGLSESFTATQNKKTKAINTTPGSFHVSTTLTTTGPCAGFGNFAPTSATLTLDSEFSFADTGASPTVHAFVGNAGGSFDLHNGDPLIEVALPAVVSGKSVTVDLTSLGTIPSTYTIYLRAHFRYTPVSGNLPSVTTSYTGFSSTATADVGAALISPATLTYQK